MKERLTVLGSGVGVHGLPYQKELRYPPGYLLEKDGNRILLDCSEGMDTRLTSLGIDYGSIHTVFISHFHPDHFQVANLVFSSALKRHHENKSPLNMKIIGPIGLEKNFWAIWNMWWKSSPNSIFGTLADLEFVELSDKDTNQLNDQAKLTGYSVWHDHGKATALAARIEFGDGFIFSYSGDSSVCDGLVEAARNANIFLCEASVHIGEDKTKESGHLNPFQAGQVSAQSGVGNIWLTHYWGKDKEKQMIDEVRKGGFKDNVHILRDFEVLPLK